MVDRASLGDLFGETRVTKMGASRLLVQMASDGSAKVWSCRLCEQNTPSQSRIPTPLYVRKAAARSVSPSRATIQVLSSPFCPERQLLLPQPVAGQAQAVVRASVRRRPSAAAAAALPGRPSGPRAEQAEGGFSQEDDHLQAAWIIRKPRNMHHRRVKGSKYRLQVDS